MLPLFVDLMLYRIYGICKFNFLLLLTLQGAEKAVPLPEVITDILKGKWDHEKTEVSLPPLVTLVSNINFTFVGSIICIFQVLWLWVPSL